MLKPIRSVSFCAVLVVASASQLVAQDSAQALLAEAEALYEEPDTSVEALMAVRAILDQIVAEHPTSDLALSILLSETIGEIDVAALDARLAEAPRNSGDSISGVASETDAAPAAGRDQAHLRGSAVGESTGPPAPEPHLAAGTEATEAALALERQKVRDLQARLLVLGYDPHGVDGIIGNGTRSALSDWQASMGFPATGYLNPQQLDAITMASETALSTWLQRPQNARLYEPPPIIALSPSNMAGSWRYATNCGSGSRVGRMQLTGAMAVAHAGGNRYSGQVSNSQGLRGRLSARLDGRTISGEINWGFLIGRTQFRGRVADQELVIGGQDSNGCSFHAVKA